jgi:hypothetical protein
MEAGIEGLSSLLPEYGPVTHIHPPPFHYIYNQRSLSPFPVNSKQCSEGIEERKDIEDIGGY